MQDQQATFSPYAGHGSLSARLLAHTLQEVLNSPRLALAYVERLALIQTIREHYLVSRHQVPGSGESWGNEVLLADIVLEGIQGCRTLPLADKDEISTNGILENRWDLVLKQYIHCRIDTEQKVEFFENEFLNYRRMVLVLFRTSRLLHQLWTSNQVDRVKSMVLQTKTRDQLNALLQRILDRSLRTLASENIWHDLVSQRYYRLVWPDRLDCAQDDDVDRKLPPKIDYHKPDEECKEDESCPVCFDPMNSSPPGSNRCRVSLKLACGHKFCTRCLWSWRQEDLRNTTTAVATWHCPMCRHEYTDE